MNKPERKHVVGIKIQGDTWEAVVSEIYHIADCLERKGPGRDMVGGGYSSGHIVVDKINPDVTHDDYFTALSQWMDEQAQGAKPKSAESV